MGLIERMHSEMPEDQLALGAALRFGIIERFSSQRKGSTMFDFTLPEVGDHEMQCARGIIKDLQLLPDDDIRARILAACMILGARETAKVALDAVRQKITDLANALPPSDENYKAHTLLLQARDLV